MPSFSLEQTEELGEYLSKVLNDSLRRASLSAANRLVGTIQNELIPAEDPQPVDRGFYRAGWRAEPTEDGADVFNTLPYASVIEHGARAENIKIGRAMIDALTAWILRKGFVKNGTSKEEKADAQQTAQRLAWAIAVSMSRKGIFNRDGTMGLHIVDKALRYVRQYVLEETKREITRSLSQ